MPCVCWNGRIIRGTEIHAAADHVKQPILHLTALLTVHEHAETFHYGPHIHACQRHTIPRLLLELAFVDPPAVDGRQTIDDASTDCEFRIGGQFREMNRGYGKLCDPDNEPLPCPLQTSQHGQIGAEIVAGGCLDVAVTELSCDH